MKKNNKVCTTILIGGKSSRMGGGIKSLKKFNNKTIFERIYEIIKVQTDNIILNTNLNNKYFNRFNIPIVNDKITGFLGPLAGIHSSLIWTKNNLPEIDWLVSIAGDTPFIPNNLIKKLYNRAILDKKKIVLAKSNSKAHPVIGIWNISLIDNLENYLNNGDRKIILWAESIGLSYCKFNESSYDPFYNINYLEDLKKAEKIEKYYF